MNRRKFLKMAGLAGIGASAATATPWQFDRKAPENAVGMLGAEVGALFRFRAS